MSHYSSRLGGLVLYLRQTKPDNKQLMCFTILKNILKLFLQMFYYYLMHFLLHQTVNIILPHLPPRLRVRKVYFERLFSAGEGSEVQVLHLSSHFSGARN